VTYEIAAEMNLKNIISESREVSQALNDFADKLEKIQNKYKSNDEILYTPEEVVSKLIEEGQEHSGKYGFKLGDIIKFTPSETMKILKAKSEG
jgi:hypothetical protein